MAKGKKNRKTGSPDIPQAESQSSGKVNKMPEPKRAHPIFLGKRFTFIDYVVVCVFFIAFCYLQRYVALMWFGIDLRSADKTLEGLSLKFFFNTMWKGFIIVALLAWLHDFFYHEPEEEDTA